MKKITFSGKPAAKPMAASPDEWVDDRHSPSEPVKRLTIDIPVSLHQCVKSQCALDGKKMADVVRELLEKRFGQEYRRNAAGNDPASN